MKRRVVITGMGVVSPIGNNKEELWDSVLNGRCGIAPITHFDTAEFKVKLAGEVRDLNLDQYIPAKEARKMDRYTQFALAAASEAWEDSGLSLLEEDREAYGVIIGSGIGGIGTIEEEKVRGMNRGYDRVSPYFIPMAISNMASGNVAIRFGLKGLCSSSVTACASAANAIGDAFRHIRDGYGDVMLAGGAEATITPLCIGGFTSLKALSVSEDPLRASIPFDAERNGFVMGEGSAVLVLEELEHALKRDAVIYGEITGYGATCDAYHITAPDPEGKGAARCMRMAIKDAGRSIEDIQYINAHGTSTKLNDAGETKAIKEVFGETAAKNLAVSSTKSMTGHLLGASAAVEAVITVLAVRNDFLPPTLGLTVPDPDCDLDYVPGKGRSAAIHAALSNSFGFGGHNATLLFEEYKEETDEV
jgi:3-oxoacyl-[acyl-carrier-protein] synthase II